MDLEKLKKLSNIDLQAECKNEEEVKIKFILPLIDLLGHERYNLESKNMDITVKHSNSKYSLLFEAKHHTKKLEDHVAQLKRYWDGDDGRQTLAILCNGKELWIFHPFWIMKDKFRDTLICVIKQNELLDKADILKNILSHDALANGTIKSHLQELEAEFEDSETKKENIKIENANIASLISDLTNEKEQKIKEIQTYYDNLISEQKQLISNNENELKNYRQLTSANTNVKKTDSSIPTFTQNNSDKISVDILDYVNYFGLIEKKQIMFCTKSSKNAENIILCCSDIKESKKYELSPEGRKYLQELPTFKETYFVADIEYIQLRKNTIEMWKKLYDEGLFPFWDPEHGPYTYHYKSLKRIALCRVYKIDYPITKDTIGKGQVSRNITNPQIVKNIKDSLNSKHPLFNLEEYKNIKENILKIIEE
ncbi:MAG: hypothetical protein NTY07_07620 [Bacteroidia bacterium]|nr:hypothetical protein [Bacteroidia bacterium]